MQSQYFVVVDSETGVSVDSHLTWPVAFRTAARNPALAILPQADKRLLYSFEEQQYRTINVTAGERPNIAPPDDPQDALDRLTLAARTLGLEGLFLHGDLKEVLKDLGGQLGKAVFRDSVRGLFVIEDVKLTVNDVELRGQWASRPATAEEAAEFEKVEASGEAHSGGSTYTAATIND